MKYLYYPGCSLEGTASEYDVSTRAFMKAMGIELVELQDWTCCGATAADTISELLSLALPARNLALAEKMDPTCDLLAPCSACYLNLKKTEEKTRQSLEIRTLVNAALGQEQLALAGQVKVRHLLDVLTNDLALDLFAEKVCRPLNTITAAPYYGCQCLRPYPAFDDPEKPTSMEPLLLAAGARIHPWTMGPKCCGASHMNTQMQVGLELSGAILAAAQGADAIVTVCPMCQMNLEAFQKKIARRRGKDLSMSILYLPQLLGLAIGLGQNELRLDLNLTVTAAFKEKTESRAPATAVV